MSQILLGCQKVDENKKTKMPFVLNLESKQISQVPFLRGKPVTIYTYQGFFSQGLLFFQNLQCAIDVKKYYI